MSGSTWKLGKIQYSTNNITSAAGMTVLLNTSDYYQRITGSTTQTIQLPDATTMVGSVGFFVINANSAGNVTVTNNGSVTLATLSPGQSTEFITNDVSTANGVWMLNQGTVLGIVVSPPSGLSGSSVDWSTSNLFTKTLGANTTFTFSSQTPGQTIVVRLTNTASNWTVTWPVAVKWSGGTAPVMTTGAFSDVYTFIYDGVNTYGSTVQKF